MNATHESYVPRYEARKALLKRPIMVWGSIVIGIVTWLVFILSAPLFTAYDHKAIGQFIYGIFSLVCHQTSERSFHLDGYPFAVCARCFGIYVGFAIGSMCYPMLRSLTRVDAPARIWLIAAMIPTAIDYLLNLSGLWQNTHLSRLLTGLLLGCISAFYVVPGLIDLSQINLKEFFASERKM